MNDAEPLWDSLISLDKSKYPWNEPVGLLSASSIAFPGFPELALIFTEVLGYIAPSVQPKLVAPSLKFSNVSVTWAGVQVPEDDEIPDELPEDPPEELEVVMQLPLPILHTGTSQQPRSFELRSQHGTCPLEQTNV